MPNQFSFDTIDYCATHTNYTTRTKRVTINNKTYSAEFPEKHSRVEGLVFNVRNDNAWDTWADHPKWVISCYIKWKNSRVWENFDVIKHVKQFGYARASDLGIYPLLFLLEKPEVMENMVKKARTAELRNEIKERKQELESLLA